MSWRPPVKIAVVARDYASFRRWCLNNPDLAGKDIKHWVFANTIRVSREFDPSGYVIADIVRLPGWDRLGTGLISAEAAARQCMRSDGRMCPGHGDTWKFGDNGGCLGCVMCRRLLAQDCEDGKFEMFAAGRAPDRPVLAGDKVYRQVELVPYDTRLTEEEGRGRPVQVVETNLAPAPVPIGAVYRNLEFTLQGLWLPGISKEWERPESSEKGKK